MPQVVFNTLWANHPWPLSPCDKSIFDNQCAIRMGVALELSGVNTISFDAMYPGRRCSAYPAIKHSRRHILAAHELATWMRSQKQIFGEVKVYKNRTSTQFKGKKGIVFHLNGWGPTDHLDLWDGTTFKTLNPIDNFLVGEEVWFWELR